MESDGNLNWKKKEEKKAMQKKKNYYSFWIK